MATNQQTASSVKTATSNKTEVIRKVGRPSEQKTVTKSSHNFSAAKKDVIYNFREFYITGRVNEKEWRFDFFLQERVKVGKEYKQIDRNEVKEFMTEYEGFNLIILSDAQADLMRT